MKLLVVSVGLLALAWARQPADPRFVNVAYGQDGLNNINAATTPVVLTVPDASGVEAGFAVTLSKNSTIPPVQTPDGRIHFFAYSAGELHVYSVHESLTHPVSKINLKREGCSADVILAAPAVTPLGNILVGAASGTRAAIKATILILYFPQKGSIWCMASPRVHAPFIVGVSAPLSTDGGVTHHQLLSIGFSGTVVYDFYSDPGRQNESISVVPSVTFGTNLSAAIWSASGLQITNDHFIRTKAHQGLSYLYSFDFPLKQGQAPNHIVAVNHFPYPWNVAANTAGEKFMANGSLVKFSPAFDTMWSTPGLMGNVLLSFDDEIVLVSTSLSLEVPSVQPSPHNLTAVNASNGEIIWAMMYNGIQGAHVCTPTQGPWTYRTPVTVGPNLLLVCNDGVVNFVAAIDLRTGAAAQFERVSVDLAGFPPNHIWFDMSMNVYGLYHAEGNTTYVMRVPIMPAGQS